MTSLFWGLVCLHSVASLSAADGSLRNKLIQIATQAKEHGDLEPLRRFAATAVDSEIRGQAYLALGYREYEARQFAAAATDLRQAGEGTFSLSDYARYYWALSAREAGQTPQALEALNGFSSLYPKSTLRLKALALQAEMLLQAGQPERTIQALTAEPRLRQIPELTLLLGQAYRDVGRPADAARTFQEIYYAFPATSESRAAADDLERLRTELGEKFPQATEEIRSARAEILLNKSLPSEALADFEGLLAEQPASSFVPRWKVGRARCLVRLKRREEAINLLGAGFAGSPDYDPQRLDTLVEAYLSKDDAPAALMILHQLRVVYPKSDLHAAALRRMGNYLVRRGDWKTASEHYRTLLELFPQSSTAIEASWRVAWDRYLQRDIAAATAAVVDHVSRYPDSPHTPAALFWLSRIAEEQGAGPEARQLFRTLQERFVHSYYALQSHQPIQRPDSSPASVEQHGTPQPPIPVSTLVRSIPPLGPLRVSACGPAARSEVMRPFLTLKDLGLEDLGEDYLIAQLSDDPDSPELLLALARLRAARGKTSAALLNARRAFPRYMDYEFSALPEELWKLLFPRDFWKFVQRQARANRLDPYIVMGLIRQESAFNPRAVSSANARGLMQILPSTVSRTRRGRIRAAQQLFDPSYNIQFGCRHLRGAIKTFQGDVERALAAYNAGETRVRNWSAQRGYRDSTEFMETIPIPATRAYVEAVLRDAAIYRELLNGKPKFAKCP